MGIISRKIFPACGSMCVCCPALRSRSRHPVKRYKKLLAEIFPKSLDGSPNERKIVKLCEYASKNPFRIPKIAKLLEERCYKELRCRHFDYINIIGETFNKLLSVCKGQMAYFSVNLLNVVVELLDNSKQDAMKTLGCQTLTRFIYCQADSTYTHNIENFVPKVCILANGSGEEHNCLRASSLQCLSAMVWFMVEYSNIFGDFEKIVRAALDNYEPDTHNEAGERRESHHHWVDEVVRCEGRNVAVGSDGSPTSTVIRQQAEKKDPSLLTREEMETPKVWARICIQRMAELAKDSTTMRQVLDPMFIYFDSGHHWVPEQGLAMIVLSDMLYFVENSRNQQLILSAVIRHLDHKNVTHDPQLKSYIIRVATALARQIMAVGVLSEIGFVSDLCRHLRKSLQVTLESINGQVSNLNISLQDSIENFLLEIAKGIDDARALFDMMALTLEKLPSVGIIARATLGSLIILAHMISSALISSTSKQVFPESLLLQLLKVMTHPDVEARVGAHQIFSILLILSSNCTRQGVTSLQSGYIYESRRWHSCNATTFASITARLEKLRKEKEGIKAEKHGKSVHDKEIDNTDARKQGRVLKNSHNFYKITSIIDQTPGSTSLFEMDPCIMKFSEDQVSQLLSAFWMQINLPDNSPSNFEALAHSFTLTLTSSCMKNPNNNLMVNFFQLTLSLRNLSLDLNNGMLPSACLRSILIFSTAMLMFAARIYQIPSLNDVLKSAVPYDIDPYLGVGDDLQVYVKPLADVREYGSAFDNQQARTVLIELRDKIYESDFVLKDILVQYISSITELGTDEVTKQLSEAFTPDETFIFGQKSLVDVGHNQIVCHSNESLSFDMDFNSNSLVEDDVTSETSVADTARFIPKLPSYLSSMSQVVSIRQLLESALEVAGQVAATSVSTSPLPYDTMASQCEALGTGTRKLSNWLVHENEFTRAADKRFPTPSLACSRAVLNKIMSDDGPLEAVVTQDPWLAMRLPPASPFDNFLKAAGC